MAVRTHHHQIRPDLPGEPHNLVLRIVPVDHRQLRLNALVRERSHNAVEVLFAGMDLRG